MKARWSVLFWTALACLAGMSWVATTFGMHLTELMNVGLVGMIIAAGVAFYAMVKAMPQKWPAIAVLVCAAPFALDAARALPQIFFFIEYPSIILAIVGNLATVIVAIAILVMQVPEPPPPPPIAPARVVD